MLRLIGALVILLLLVGPLLAQAGLLSETGLMRDFVTLETRGFISAVNWVRGVIGLSVNPVP